LHFASVDVETANPSLSSICQIGVAVFDEGRLEQSWVSLVNPETFFDPINISIHGIDENAVRFSPCWASVFPSVSALIAGSVVVSHTAFDRASIIRACERADISIPNLSWLDSAKVVRRTWTSLSRKGYGLSNVAALLGIEYRPHDALEDARCAGEVLLRAMKETGLNLAQWIDRVKQPIGASGSGRIERKGNLSGPLHGEVLVFTGSLTMLRSQAADLAAAVGCDVETELQHVRHC